MKKKKSWKEVIGISWINTNCKIIYICIAVLFVRAKQDKTKQTKPTGNNLDIQLWEQVKETTACTNTEIGTCKTKQIEKDKRKDKKKGDSLDTDTEKKYKQLC